MTIQQTYSFKFGRNNYVQLFYVQLFISFYNAIFKIVGSQLRTNLITEPMLIKKVY